MPDAISLTAAIGKVRGRMGSKENRIAKLLARWGELDEKFRGLVERGGGTTETARLAFGCLVMMQTGIRTGRESSAEGFVCQNKFHPDFGKVVSTYGLTTLKGCHVERVPACQPTTASMATEYGVVTERTAYYTAHRLVLSFTGKKLVGQQLTITDPFMVRYCPEPADPADPWLGVEYGDLYKFVKVRVGAGFSPKDIRATFVNRLFVKRFLAGPAAALEAAATARDRKAVVRECIQSVADTTGHTLGVCRSSYLSTPLQRVLASYAAGTRITE